MSSRSVSRPAGAPQLIRAARTGAARGLLATLVMSGGFYVAQRRGMIDRLPPRLIVERFFPDLPPERARLLAAAAHLAYGTAAGVAYGILPLRSTRSAIGFALFIWGASYEGWVPIAGVIPPAHRDDRSRAFTILATHLLYGLSLRATKDI